MTEEPIVRDLLQGPNLQTALLPVREVLALLQDNSLLEVPVHLQDSSQLEVRALLQDSSLHLEVPDHLQVNSLQRGHLQGNNHHLVVPGHLQDNSHHLVVLDHLQDNSHHLVVHDPPVAIPVHPVPLLNPQVVLQAVIQEEAAGQWVVVAIQEVEEVADQWVVVEAEEAVEAEEGDEYMIHLSH